MHNNLYAKNIYTEYRISKNKNLFEIDIDNFILGNIPGITPQIIDAIWSLEESKIRFAILSIMSINNIKGRVHKEDFLSESISISNIENNFKRLKNNYPLSKEEIRDYGFKDIPENRASEMLSTFKVEWKNPNLKWFIPSGAMSTLTHGVIIRLMEGLSEWEKDEYTRYKHIIENMIYLSDSNPKSLFLHMCIYDIKNEFNLNVYNGSFIKKDFLEHMKEVWEIEKFNIILGSPPFTIKDGGAKASSIPIYNIYTELGATLSDKVLFLTPSRWFADGKGLSSFREFMKECGNIKKIVHFDNSEEFYGQNIEIKGGVSYFLFDKNHQGECEFNGQKIDLSTFDIIVSKIESYDLLYRFSLIKSVSSICDSRTYFNIKTNDKRLFDEECFLNDKICYVSKHKGFIKYIDDRDIKKSKDFRIALPRSFPRGKTRLDNLFLIRPGEYLSDSYISFKINQDEDKSLVSYLKTKFVNFLIDTRRYSQDIKPSTFRWVPLVPFDREWTDEMLFDYFNLSKKERTMILSA